MVVKDAKLAQLVADGHAGKKFSECPMCRKITQDDFLLLSKGLKSAEPLSSSDDFGEERIGRIAMWLSLVLCGALAAALLWLK